MEVETKSSTFITLKMDCHQEFHQFQSVFKGLTKLSMILDFVIISQIYNISSFEDMLNL